MKYFNLTNEEKELLEEFERGEWKEVDNPEEERRKAVLYAKNTLNKLKNINIRVTLRDLQKLKSRAVEQGLPYQSILSALLHQYAEKRIKLVL